MGALRRDDRTFIVALLACGWPNHKTYKWLDTRKLMEYGLENYEYRNIYKEMDIKPVKILEGIPQFEEYDPYAEVTVELEMQDDSEKSADCPAEGELDFLLSANDEVRIDVSYAGELEAPVKKGTKVGKISYNVNGETVKEYGLVLKDSVGKKDLRYMGKYILQEYLL